MPRPAVPVVLSIAGSDSGGGAGVQADIKTCAALGAYCTTAITALTAQNTCGVQEVHVPPPSFLSAQLNSVMSDIHVDVVKTGMLPDAASVRIVARFVREHRAALRAVVVDPVLVATSGDALAGDGALAALRDELLPLATVVTPNAPEAEALLARPRGSLVDEAGMREACEAVGALGARAVLVKGGHVAGMRGGATDVLWDGAGFEAVSRPWVDGKNTHGTGCTLASAIAAGLAKGADVRSAVRAAKDYVHRGIAGGLDIGSGHGPLDHMHVLLEDASRR